MFPSEPRLAKQVHVDATIMARRFVPHVMGPGMHGETEQYRIAIPKGSVVIMDIFGTNLNREMAGPLLIPIHIKYILHA
jgi:hypothetical protein